MARQAAVTQHVVLELFEKVLLSLSWASFKPPATSAMENPIRAGVVDLEERNTDD